MLMLLQVPEVGLVGGGGGGCLTPLYGLYRDVLVDRIWFLVPLP